MRCWRSEEFFYKNFLQLTLSSLTFIWTWHRWIIILNFSRNIILYFNTVIRLGIELKMNVLPSIYVLFPGQCKGASKTCAIEQILLNSNILKSTINTATVKQNVKSVNFHSINHKSTDVFYWSLLLTLNDF